MLKNAYCDILLFVVLLVPHRSSFAPGARFVAQQTCAWLAIRQTGKKEYYTRVHEISHAFKNIIKCKLFLI